jgi:hypothetical protein
VIKKDELDSARYNQGMRGNKQYDIYDDNYDDNKG